MNTISQCPCCMEKHALNKVTVKESGIFKDVTVEFTAEYYYCDKTDETYADEDQISSNDISMKNAYRIKMGLLTSMQIADIRRKYNISQSDLCTLLGWGGKTITRYESHQVQDIAHDTILRKLDNDPEWFLELLDKSQSSLSISSYNKSREAGIILFEQFHDHLLRSAILSKYIRYLNDKEASGNKAFSLDAAIEMIRYYSSEITDLSQDKLMRLLWYADLLSYKRYKHSISGMVYRSIADGAAPLAYEIMIDLNTDHGNMEKPYALTKHDKEILKEVAVKFGKESSETTGKSINTDYNHTNNKSFDIILYEDAKALEI